MQVLCQIGTSEEDKINWALGISLQQKFAHLAQQCRRRNDIHSAIYFDRGRGLRLTEAYNEDLSDEVVDAALVLQEQSPGNLPPAKQRKIVENVAQWDAIAPNEIWYGPIVTAELQEAVMVNADGDNLLIKFLEGIEWFRTKGPPSAVAIITKEKGIINT